MAISSLRSRSLDSKNSYDEKYTFNSSVCVNDIVLNALVYG